MKICELHDRLYDILIIIYKICRENDIPYWVHGGTAIGAVRERDFIPWDDDLDIKIMSEDYEAFREAMIKNLPSHLHLIEPPDFYPYFYDMVIRILDDRWFLRKEKPEAKAYKDYTNRVGIDVFLSCGKLYIISSFACVWTKPFFSIINPNFTELFLNVIGINSPFFLTSITVSTRLVTTRLSMIGMFLPANQF